MNIRALTCILILGPALASSGCTLISRPEALTTLQLSLPAPAADSAWPSGLALGSVRPVSALQSNRLLVVDGAKLMQHQGLRWSESPAIMLAEQMQLRRVRAIEGSTLGTHRIASVDVWLSRFDLLIESSGGRSARVTLAAELKCAQSDSRIEFPPTEHSQPPDTDDAQSVAEAFNLATAEAVAALLRTAKAHLQSCTELPPLPITPAR